MGSAKRVVPLMLLSSRRMLSTPRRREKNCFTIKVGCTCPELDVRILIGLTEKLLANGDKWEPELAAAARADAPYR